jgi:YD repeat-containing protein
MRSHEDPRLVLASLIALALALWALPAPAAESYTYDTQSRLTDVSYQNGSSFHYTYDANGNIVSIVTSLVTAVEGGASTYQFALGPTTPNPGSGPRDLSFTMAVRGRVTLRVFDVTGRLLETLVDHDLDRGRHDVHFFTDRWSAGVYFYRLESAGVVRSARMVVLR